ncbi:MAG: O-antigen ligase family protein [Meiothermus sp.]|uniref:O-antigen ligase family protein n=1 Tax=Meiothermus sp. TaxID=1955249 RepID=UPI0025DDEC8B|nr:O-antigen ligase family protein [Meiothermus sp.]MCS7069196.1 O-antigen ligase family protein [Meiothermus sp.]
MGTIIAGLSRIPLALWAWWGLGLLSVLWSLTPANTLVLGLWELAYLAAFAAGGWLAGLVGLNLALLGYGLLTTLTLAWSGLVMYFSGSAHYVAGAQALVLLPLGMVWMFRGWPLLAGILLTGALYMALMSAARAVYLPLGAMAFLLVWRLWREGVAPWRLGVGLGAVLLAVIGIDSLLPFSPIESALGLKASLARQTQDLAAEGSFGSRLQMWAQTLHIALEAPFGTGNGSFRDVLAAYQQYPGVLFSNAHNYYLEAAATGGWLRLLLLLGVLGWVLWRGWNSSAWPWALGAAGLWATLAFDITGMYPAVMMLAFASLGAVYRQILGSEGSDACTKPKWGLAVSLVGIGLGVGLAVWWYWPCAPHCARHLGYRPEVLAEAARLSGAERATLLEKAARLNPKSLWVYRAKLQFAQTPEEQLATLSQINRAFPLASPSYYLQQARLAAQLGRKAEAIAALEAGLKRFPPGIRPAGTPLDEQVRKSYQDWSVQAPELLKELQSAE